MNDDIERCRQGGVGCCRASVHAKLRIEVSAPCNGFASMELYQSRNVSTRCGRWHHMITSCKTVAKAGTMHIQSSVEKDSLLMEILFVFWSQLLGGGLNPQRLVTHQLVMAEQGARHQPRRERARCHRQRQDLVISLSSEASTLVQLSRPSSSRPASRRLMAFASRTRPMKKALHRILPAAIGNS